MSNHFNDYHAFTLMCLGLSLCDNLKSRASNQERIYMMGEVSKNGTLKLRIKMAHKNFELKMGWECILRLL